MTSIVRFVSIGVTAVVCGASAGTARADAASTAFCAQLSTESAPSCGPVEEGPEPAWTRAAASWKPESTPSLPVVAIWAAPGMGTNELAHTKEALIAFKQQVAVALKFAQTKNAESLRASLLAQKAVLDKIIKDESPKQP
jgi:hypothetical protein